MLSPERFVAPGPDVEALGEHVSEGGGVVIRATHVSTISREDWSSTWGSAARGDAWSGSATFPTRVASHMPITTLAAEVPLARRPE